MILLSTSSAWSSSFQILYSFSNGSDGGFPNGGLALGPLGAIFGSTSYVGTGHHGTLFEYRPATKRLNTLATFSRATGTPLAGPVLLENRLYQATDSYEPQSGGFIYGFDLATGTLKRLYEFDRATQGVPYVQLAADVKGNLLGGTWLQPSGGTLFSFDLASKSYSLIHTFKRPNIPSGPLATQEGDMYYGVAAISRFAGSSLIYRYIPATGTYDVLYRLTHLDGRFAWGALADDGHGRLYGVTSDGGPLHHGSIFSFQISTQQFQTLYAFSGTDGANPGSGVLFSADGQLYGSTQQGGSGSCGTIFRFDIVIKKLTILHEFDKATDGCYPSGMVMNHVGALIGATYSGGASFSGAIFQFLP